LARRFRTRAFNPYDPTLLNFLCKTIGVLEYEVLLMISLDARRAYICDEIVSIGNRDRIDGRYRFLVQRALDNGAASLLLVHNHPSGNPQPSHEDIRFTRALNALARALEIELADHLVVTRSAVHSIMLGRPA
jgi:DNA repair protein RadC